MRSAIAGCVSFERLETRGLLDAMLTRHSWLKKYLPGFLRLPFQGGDGTTTLLDAITHALACYDRERPVGKGAPIRFAKGFWAKGKRSATGVMFIATGGSYVATRWASSSSTARLKTLAASRLLGV